MGMTDTENRHADVSWSQTSWGQYTTTLADEAEEPEPRQMSMIEILLEQRRHVDPHEIANMILSWELTKADLPVLFRNDIILQEDLDQLLEWRVIDDFDLIPLLREQDAEQIVQVMATLSHRPWALQDLTDLYQKSVLDILGRVHTQMSAQLWSHFRSLGPAAPHPPSFLFYPTYQYILADDAFQKRDSPGDYTVLPEVSLLTPKRIILPWGFLGTRVKVSIEALFRVSGVSPNVRLSRQDVLRKARLVKNYQLRINVRYARSTYMYPSGGACIKVVILHIGVPLSSSKLQLEGISKFVIFLNKDPFWWEYSDHPSRELLGLIGAHALEPPYARPQRARLFEQLDTDESLFRALTRESLVWKQTSDTYDAVHTVAGELLFIRDSYLHSIMTKEQLSIHRK